MRCVRAVDAALAPVAPGRALSRADVERSAFEHAYDYIGSVGVSDGGSGGGGGGAERGGVHRGSGRLDSGSESSGSDDRVEQAPAFDATALATAPIAVSIVDNVLRCVAQRAAHAAAAAEHKWQWISQVEAGRREAVHGVCSEGAAGNALLDGAPVSVRA